MAIRGLGARAELERAESDRRLGIADGVPGADAATDVPIEIPPDLPRGLIPRPEPAVRQPAARLAAPESREPAAAPASRHASLVWPESAGGAGVAVSSRPAARPRVVARARFRTAPAARGAARTGGAQLTPTVGASGRP